MNNINIKLADKDRKALKYLASKVLPLDHDETDIKFIFFEYDKISDELDKLSLYSIRRYADVLARTVKKIKEQSAAKENSTEQKLFQLYEKKYRLVSNEASRMIKYLKEHHTDKKNKLIMKPGNIFSKIAEIENSRKTEKIREIDDDTLKQEHLDYEHALKNLRTKRENNKKINFQIEVITKEIVLDNTVNRNSAYTYEYKMKRFMRKYMIDSDSLDVLVTGLEKVKDGLDKIPLNNGTNLKGYISAILCYIKYFDYSEEEINETIQWYRTYLKEKLRG